jgi:hypothetical protein
LRFLILIYLLIGGGGIVSNILNRVLAIWQLSLILNRMNFNKSWNGSKNFRLCERHTITISDLKINIIYVILNGTLLSPNIGI